MLYTQCLSFRWGKKSVVRAEISYLVFLKIKVLIQNMCILNPWPHNMLMSETF